MSEQKRASAFYHLPGLFEFYEFYKVFLPLYREHREYFYDWCEIGSVYGSPQDCLWGGGRVENGQVSAEKVLSLMTEYGISARLTFSNSLLRQEHLSDRKCNRLCAAFEKGGSAANGGAVSNGVIVHSDVLAEYLQAHFPDLYLVSSTTKVITNFSEFRQELGRREFSFVVPDFRLNKNFEGLEKLSSEEKAKVEFLCNECCWFGCSDRKACYENVSRKNLGEDVEEHVCKAPGGTQGYRFSKAMENAGFIGVGDIQKIYVPMGFSNFKIEGRGLGNAVLLEFLLYYMTKPEYVLKVREEIYLDCMLDLF